MYYNGTGVTRDLTETARLFKLANDQGYQPARDATSRITAQHPAGIRVRITGLATASHLNGTLGTAVQPPKPLLVAAGRIAVRVDGQTKSVSLCWANVQHAYISACGARR